MRVNSYCNDIAHRPSILQIALVQGWCRASRVYRQGNIPILFTSKWQLLVHTAPQVSMQRATVNQHPPAHHEGWMINGEFLLGSRSLADHGG